jgi:hypothetical protein
MEIHLAFDSPAPRTSASKARETNKLKIQRNFFVCQIRKKGF